MSMKLWSELSWPVYCGNLCSGMTLQIVERNLQIPSAWVCMGLDQRDCVLENLVANISKLKEHYQSRDGV